MSAPQARPSAWRAVAAATALNAPLGSLYAFSVFLKPLEALLGVSRADLATGRAGPLIVEEYDSTCVVPPGACAERDGAGNIAITL